MSRPQKKSLDAPDERIRLGGISADIVHVGDASVALNIFSLGPIAHSGVDR